MKKTNKILTNVLLGALTLSSLGLANVQAGEVEPTVVPKTEASVKIADGIIEDTNNTTALTFDGPGFSFKTFFGDSPSTTNAKDGKVELIVNDQRSLNNITDGWKLTAQLSAFSRTEGGESLGKGTFISLNNGVPSTEFAFKEEIIAPEVSSDSIELKAGGVSERIWSASRVRVVDEKLLSPVGVDEWTLIFPAEKISLTIPNDELVGGEHKAEITWVFSNTFAEAVELED